MGDRLLNKRVLCTHADQFMGPAIIELFRQEGAHVVADVSDLQPEGACERAVENAGDVDVLIVNLSHVPRSAPVSQITDDDIGSLLSTLVTPLVRLCRAVALPMIARKSGKVVVMSSAAPLRGMPNNAAYCAARGAQNAFVRAAGLELAPHSVQVNAIAQNYVNNPTYFPPDLIHTERFLKHVQRNIPAQRIGEAWESAELALFLASDKSNFIVGQVVPLAGGWATTTG
jgi:2-keto-3-deoxy-L-fuconate dehydrogenase